MLKIRSLWIGVALSILSLAHQAEALEPEDLVPEFSGYIKPRFSIIANTGYNPEDQNGFALEEARLAINDELAFSPVTGVWFYKIDVALPSGAVAIRDVYAGYRPYDALGFRIGQFKVPFAYAFLNSTPRLMFANRAQASRLAYGRDRGAQIDGTIDFGELLTERAFLLSYATGVFNGEGAGGGRNQNERFIYASRILLEPMGAVGSDEPDLDPCNGKWKQECESQRPLRFALGGSVGRDPEVGKGISPRDLGRSETRWAVDAHLKVEGFALHAEYAAGRASGVAGDGGIDRSAYYAQAGYNPEAVSWLEPTLRYEFVDVDEAEDNSVRDPGLVEFQSRRLITAGLNLYAYRHNAKIQINYVLTDLQEGVKTSPQGDPLFGDEVILQLQVGF